MATTSLESHDLQPGIKIRHPELGEGVVVGREPTGYITVFFRAHGERQVPAETLHAAADAFDSITQSLASASPERLEHLWLALEAEELPLMDSAATLTSAKVDLLPHQVVLVHRVANARPKRFLVADEVGLGKTIEAALILRELASRGELARAIMIVPAGLVENWRRELNDIFNLDFEVFGSEGDVTDRKSNAFAKHNRLIVSVDTLKRPARIKKLLAAPPWDLVVFDEAHHLSVYRYGNKVKKTENFKLAEAVRDHCRDLILLSATPHQGDHFRFWMLIRLLNPELFESDQDMVRNRHRLNAVVIRRTKADACAQSSTAQVYNLVATNTIEGQIYLLLEEKLADIAKALGKVDDQGQIAEDLRAQVLGQLSNTIGYDKLYQDAVSDPALRRTREELEVAMTNANLARQVVFELFQELDRFNLGDYKKFDDAGRGMQRLVNFISRAARLAGEDFRAEGINGKWRFIRSGEPDLLFTTDRDAAVQEDALQLVGLEHPVVSRFIRQYAASAHGARALAGKMPGIAASGLLTFWKIMAHGKDGQIANHVVRIGMNPDGERAPWLEHLGDKILGMQPANVPVEQWRAVAATHKTRLQEMLHRELSHTGIITDEMSYSAVPLAVIGVES